MEVKCIAYRTLLARNYQMPGKYPDKSYQVFWNVKDFGARGDGSTLAIKYVTLKRLNLF